MAWRRRSERADATQMAVMKRLRSAGMTVEFIGQPVDLVVGYRGVNVLAEVKRAPGPRGGDSKSGQHLNDKQREFFQGWRGLAVVVTLETCVEVVLAATEITTQRLQTIPRGS